MYQFEINFKFISVSHIMFLIDMEIKVLTKSEDLQFWEEILGKTA